MRTLLTWRRFASTAVLLVLCLALAACTNSKVTQANFDKIQVGVTTLQEVEELFGGPGTKEGGGDGSNVAAQFGVDVEGMGRSSSGRSRVDTYMWERGDKTFRVDVDQNGIVRAKRGS